MGRESIDYLCEDIPHSDQNMGDAHQAQLLKRFVQKHRLAGSTVTTALHCGDLMIRTLALPFQDARRLTQVIPSEVESMIPLPLEDLAVDYELMTQRKQDKRAKGTPASQVLVAAAQRSALSHHVQQLTEAGIEPNAVRIDALALFSLIRRMSDRRSEPFRSIAVVDIGATTTTMCLSYEGDPWILRAIRCGMNHLNQGLVQRDESSEKVGQKRPLTVEQMEPGFSRFVRELRCTLHAYEASTCHRLQHVLFCGGGAEFTELTALLGRCLELEPVNLSGLHQAPCAPAYAVAMGLALMGGTHTVPTPWSVKATASAINLKRVMNTTLARTQERRRRLWHVGLAILSILLFAIGDLTLQVMLKQSRLRDLKTELRSQFQERFAGIETITDEVDQAKAALQAVQKTKDLLGGEQVPVLQVLTDLVRQFPKRNFIRISALAIEPEAIQIEAETDSFESMEKIRQGLLGFPGTGEVTVRDARVGSTPTQILFRITLARGRA